MWVRRGGPEIRALQRARRWREVRVDPIGPGICALGCAIFATALQSLGIPPGAEPGVVLLPAGVATELLYASALVFITVYLLQIALSRIRAVTVARSVTVICEECQRPLPRTSSRRCECGGHLEPIAYWRWVERDATAPGELAKG